MGAELSAVNIRLYLLKIRPEMGTTRIQQALYNAIACAMIIIAINLVFYATDLIYTWGGIIARTGQGLVFLIAFIILMISWKKKQEVAITYKDAFLFGLMFLGFYIAIMFVYEFCFYTFIAPDFYQTLMDKTLQMMVDLNLPEEQLEETRQEFEKGLDRSSPIDMSLWGIPTRLVSDVIILAILAIFMRKKPILQ